MKFLKLLSFSALFFILMMGINSFRFRYGITDAFWRTLMTPFEGTVWSTQFEESEFSKIRIGMNGSEVAKLIGNPLRKDCGKEECFLIYSWQDTGTADFDQRWVIVDLSDRVIEIRKSFFID